VTYTQAALLAVPATVVLDLAVLKTRLLRTRSFWIAYVIVLGFQLITNGILTGRGIVYYAGDAVAGVGSHAGQTPPFLGHGRIAYAPFEDLLFGFALVVQTLSWWVFWGRRLRPDASAADRRPGSGS
jgi:hypothetical protein